LAVATLALSSVFWLALGIDAVMAKARLIDLYPVESRVEIMLGEANWAAGIVIRHQPPGVWVQVQNGRSWFVTNRRRIRPFAAGGHDES
jgi:hypothetical protein